ncbi:rod shape-determining protein MreD [Pseudogemmobacter sp. W21_MBD1_M6]|uniref:rod shape-determining protein MreD n=1 Tax=Pseudogemmobacter sp. W21_MBD1_M6 TaxID=3240271 RepID=UPI003F9B8243
MVDPITTRRWIFRGLFVAASLLIIFVLLLPLDLSAGQLPGPDILICLTYAWVLRRPNYVPVLLIAAVFLVTDLLFMRPPGLLAGLVVMGSEFLRARESTSRELTFLLEWAMVGGVLIAVTLANRLFLLIVMVEQPALGLVLLQFLTTLLAYPVIVIISRYGLGLRKIAPGEVDSLGHRL